MRVWRRHLSLYRRCCCPRSSSCSSEPCERALPHFYDFSAVGAITTFVMPQFIAKGEAKSGHDDDVAETVAGSDSEDARVTLYDQMERHRGT